MEENIIEMISNAERINDSDLIIELDDAKIILNLIKKQKNIIDSIKRILEDEELDYCDTLDEIYHFYEEVVNNDR